MNTDLSGWRPANRDDEMLLAMLRQGDIAAFNTLFYRYNRRAVEFANTLVPDLFMAEELVSDVFMSFWARREELPRIPVFRAYLFTAVRYQAKRANIIFTRSSTRPIQEYSERPDASPADPAASLESLQLSDALLRLIEALPPQRRLIFKLKKMDCLSYKAIAQLLGITEKTVENQLAEAVRSLRRQVRSLDVSAFLWMELLVWLLR